MNETITNPLETYKEQATTYERAGQEQDALAMYQVALGLSYRIDPGGSPEQRELEHKVQELRGASWGI